MDRPFPCHPFQDIVGQDAVGPEGHERYQHDAVEHIPIFRQVAQQFRQYGQDDRAQRRTPHDIAAAEYAVQQGIDDFVP